MWMRRVVGLLAAALVSAQSSSNPPSNSASNSLSPSGGSTNSTQPSPSITVITSLSTSIGFASGASRILTTAVVTDLITSTIQPAAPTSAAGSNPSSSSQSPTSTVVLPTGTVGSVTDLAPSPGATGGGGSYGPGDSYISAARSLQRNVPLLVGGLVVGLLVL
ncbi:hypothetical protein K438DRAFT_1800256 [Mycena galopus ATCC 62051]|nr:hypothetical protein K438DRAFT_1800256 [Mycena galopus ATCC 62051]